MLIDIKPLRTVAEVGLAGQYGREWTDEVKAPVVGTRLDVTVPAILRYFGQDASPEEVSRDSKLPLERMVELHLSTQILMPGAGELLASLRAAELPLALVSSSFRVLVDAVLDQGVGPFALTLAGDEVCDAKPHLEPCLTAAGRLGVPVARCVVIQDSPSGVAAAQAAGNAVLAVPSVPGVVFDPAPRRRVVRGLTGVSVAYLRALVP